MIGEFIFNIFNDLVLLVNSLGYIGIFIGMTIESSFIPFPSEIILLPAGALIASGQMSFLAVFFFALLGTILGALINFFLARHLGRRLVDFYIKKYGKFLFITNSKLSKVDLYFKNHGEITSFVGRLIPVARQLISLPAGFSKMNLFKFIFYTALGAGIWTFFLIYIGYLFGEKIGILVLYSNPISIFFVIISVIIILIYFILRKKKKN